jgi:uncharacterized membrane protein
MRLDLSLLGWIHTSACLAALALGAINLVARKGTSLHRRIGQCYLLAILLVGVTSLGIYRQHRFFFPHWLAIATIVLAALAYAFARFRRPRPLWLHGHITSTVLTYYLLLGGGVNEVFLRVDLLRPLARGFPSPAIGLTQVVLMMLTLIMLIRFNARFSGKRAPAVPPSEDRSNTGQPPTIPAPERSLAS